jgi:hypothetical protein
MGPSAPIPLPGAIFAFLSRGSQGGLAERALSLYLLPRFALVFHRGPRSCGGDFRLPAVAPLCRQSACLNHRLEVDRVARDGWSAAPSRPYRMERGERCGRCCDVEREAALMLRVFRGLVDAGSARRRGPQQAFLRGPRPEGRGHLSTRIKVPSTSHQSSSPRTQATVQVKERGRRATAAHSGKDGKLRPIRVSRRLTFTTSGEMTSCSPREIA